MDIAALREDYRRSGFDESEADPDPIKQFRSWFAQAVDADIGDVNAMSLATATSGGVPSVRMVLLKGVDDGGFVFFTNYASQKGRELEENPRAGLCFYWYALERQVRIAGVVTRVADEESDAYFATRPAGSRISAAVSAQSSIVSGRAPLESAAAELWAQYPDGDVPRPKNWGGYRLKPDSMEFWQGRSNRLHDRVRYRREGTAWVRERLAP